MRFFIIIGAALIAYAINPAWSREIITGLFIAAVACVGLGWDILEFEIKKKQL